MNMPMVLVRGSNYYGNSAARSGASPARARSGRGPGASIAGRSRGEGGSQPIGRGRRYRLAGSDLDVHALRPFIGGSSEPARDERADDQAREPRRARQEVAEPFGANTPADVDGLQRVRPELGANTEEGQRLANTRRIGDEVVEQDDAHSIATEDGEVPFKLLRVDAARPCTTGPAAGAAGGGIFRPARRSASASRAAVKSVMSRRRWRCAPRGAPEACLTGFRSMAMIRAFGLNCAISSAARRE